MFRKRIPSKRSESDFASADPLPDFAGESASVTLGVAAGLVEARGKPRTAARRNGRSDLTFSPFNSMVPRVYERLRGMALAVFRRK
jgi:hypothetical protein